MADSLSQDLSPLLELRNVSKRYGRPPDLAERIGITLRQFGRWDEARILPLFAGLQRDAFEREAGNGGNGGYGDRGGGGSGGNGGEEERRRILAALDANNWRRQDTAATLGISRKVLWEKMRKYQIADGETELRELE